MSETMGGLPWSAVKVGGGWQIVDANCETVAHIEPWSLEADRRDAEFAVKAVNAHEALVEALKRSALTYDFSGRLLCRHCDAYVADPHGTDCYVGAALKLAGGS